MIRWWSVLFCGNVDRKFDAEKFQQFPSVSWKSETSLQRNTEKKQGKLEMQLCLMVQVLTRICSHGASARHHKSRDVPGGVETVRRRETRSSLLHIKATTKQIEFHNLYSTQWWQKSPLEQFLKASKLKILHLKQITESRHIIVLQFYMQHMHKLAHAQKKRRNKMMIHWGPYSNSSRRKKPKKKKFKIRSCLILCRKYAEGQRTKHSIIATMRTPPPFIPPVLFIKYIKLTLTLNSSPVRWISNAILR